MMLRWQYTLIPISLLIVMAGCGSPGAPQPPSLKLPTPPGDLTAARAGNVVTLHWTMPRRATDRVLLAGDQRAVICRAVAGRPCTASAELVLQANAAASYADTLPPDLRTGAPRLLTYTVLLENRRHQSAGPSNVVYVAAGDAPPSVTELKAETTTRGVELHWQRASGSPDSPGAAVEEVRLIRLHRTRLAKPPAEEQSTAQEGQAGVAQPGEQTLEVLDPAAKPETSLAGGWSLDHANDADAALNQPYRYSVERVARLTLEGHTLEVTSAGSNPATINARDLFPPAIPSGLEAVADAESGTIDLSWTADTDSDLAGYIVYRRTITGSTGPVRVSGASPLPDPAWRDKAALPNIRYAYSVSAVDTSGNESVRSQETEESVTPVPHDIAHPAANSPRAQR